MGGGGSKGGDTTTVQKADPWSGVQGYLSRGYGVLDRLYTEKDPVTGKYMLQEGPQYFPGQTVATPNALEQTGQGMQLDQLGNMAGLGAAGAGGVGTMLGQGGLGGMYGLGAAMNAANTLSGYGASTFGQGMGTAGLGTGGALQGMQHLLGAGDVQNNPYFASAMQAAIRPVQEQFTEQVLPGIRQGAIGAGQMGGSRQGIAEGIATRGYLDTIGDITANMGSQAYGQGLQAVQAGAGIGQGLLSGGAGLAGMGIGAQGAAGGLGQGLFGSGLESVGRGTALAPTAQQGLLTPGMAAEQIGQQRTADEQAQIDAEMQRWNYGQQLPYSMISDYLAILSGAPGGTTASTMSGPSQQRSALMGGLGGAMSGAGMGSMFGPWGTAIGAIGGGLYGLFG